MSCSSPPGLWMVTLWHACCLTSILIWQIHTLWWSSLQDVWNVTSFKNVMSSRNPLFHQLSHHVHPELIPLTSLNQSDCVSNCSLYMRNLHKVLTENFMHCVLQSVKFMTFSPERLLLAAGEKLLTSVNPLLWHSRSLLLYTSDVKPVTNPKHTKLLTKMCA